MSKNPFPAGVKSFAKVAVLCLLAAFCAARASADSVGVNFTVSGSAGAWTLDFSVTNNINAGQVVYFFGVSLPAQDKVGSPSGWGDCTNICTAGTLNTASPLPNGINLNGPNITFNNIWHVPGSDQSDLIAFGDTLSGFEAEVNSILPPTSVEFFAIGFDNTPNGTAPYTGGGEFMISGDCIDAFGNTCAVQDQENPGFAGVATAPEPSSLLLLAASLFGLVALPRRRATSN